MRYFIVVVTAAMFFISCTCAAQESDETPITVTGRIEHFSEEGGFYGIDADNGSQYRPVRLEDSFKIEGLKVKATIRPLKKKLLIGTWIEPVEIVDIERIR